MEYTPTKLKVKNSYSYGIAIPFHVPIPRTKRSLRLWHVWVVLVFQILFFRIQILLRFYQTFYNFVSDFLNHQNIILKNKFFRYS
jgi:hypothetical protein